MAIDDTVPLTPGGNDAFVDETNDSAHTLKVPDAEAVVQPILEGSAAPVVPFAMDGPLIVDDLFSNAPPS